MGEPALSAARAVAPNYRLAPQYPFPCALQDLLASCVYHASWSVKYLAFTYSLSRPLPSSATRRGRTSPCQAVRYHHRGRFGGRWIGPSSASGHPGCWPATASGCRAHLAVVRPLPLVSEHLPQYRYGTYFLSLPTRLLPYG